MVVMSAIHISFFFFLQLLIQSSSWVFHARSGRQLAFRSLSDLRVAEVVDAEFERLDNEKTVKDDTHASVSNDLEDSKGKSLFDMSLESDPEMHSVAVPFVSGNDYIDTKLAFTVDLDGVAYGIGVPFEPAAAVTVENSKDGSISYFTPDNEENEELLEIMAAQLQIAVGPDLKLKRTPRVLTISGPLDSYTENWEADLVPKPVEADKFLEIDDDEDLDFFHKFMKEELGEEEYTRTLEEDSDDISDELLALFSVPGMGDKENDLKGISELIESMDNPDAQMNSLEEFGETLEHDGAALKLVSYILPDGKSYSLVRLLRPYTLVARQVTIDEETRFELLSPEEEKLVIPRLEEVCKDDLARIGLQLD